jgi:hypothetical protein
VSELLGCRPEERVDRAGVIGIAPRNGDERVTAGRDRTPECVRYRLRIRDVLEHVAAQDRADPEVRQALEEVRGREISRDVDPGPGPKLVMEDLDLATFERLVEHLLEPRLGGSKLGGAGADAQQRRQLVIRKSAQLSCQPGSLRLQHWVSMTAPLAFSRVAARQQARRLGARAAALAETRRAIAVVFLVSVAVWWLQALVMPLDAGRDLATYLGAYVQLFQAHPIDLGYVLGRTPVASLVSGGLLQFAGGALAEPVMSVLYGASIVAWFLTARTFSRAASLLAVLVLLAYPGYGILFHELSSDALFAAAFAGWSLVAVRVLQAPSTRRFALLGAGVGVLALIRPSNQILLLIALVPLALRAPWRTRVLSGLAFAVPAVVLIGAWTLNNGLRYDNYTFVRGGNATVPFFRAFVTDRIVRPSNGPASRELARVVRRQLLPLEPYRSYGITLDEFFARPSARMEVDLLALSDRLKGWHSNYRWLRDIGDEAVRAGALPRPRGTSSHRRSTARRRPRRATTRPPARLSWARRRCRSRRKGSPFRRLMRAASARRTTASTRSGPHRASTISSSFTRVPERGTTRFTAG